MSKLESFLKRRTTAAAKKAPAAREPAAVEEPPAPAGGKEEWVKDVVDVEIVPVAVRKADGASDFEDEEIELPSSAVKSNFEWKRADAARPAPVAEEPKPATVLGGILQMKIRRRPADDWIPLEAACERKPAAEPVAEAAPKKRKEHRPRAFVLAPKDQGDDEVKSLTGADVWRMLAPWPRATFLAA